MCRTDFVIAYKHKNHNLIDSYYCRACYVYNKVIKGQSTNGMCAGFGCIERERYINTELEPYINTEHIIIATRNKCFLSRCNNEKDRCALRLMFTNLKCYKDNMV